MNKRTLLAFLYLRRFVFCYALGFFVIKLLLLAACVSIGRPAWDILKLLAWDIPPLGFYVWGAVVDGWGWRWMWDLK